MGEEYVVVYWAHGSKRYTAVGIPKLEQAQEYARKMEAGGSKAKIVKMPSREYMSAVTDALPQDRRAIW